MAHPGWTDYNHITAPPIDMQPGDRLMLRFTGWTHDNAVNMGWNFNMPLTELHRLYLGSYSMRRMLREYKIWRKE